MRQHPSQQPNKSRMPKISQVRRPVLYSILDTMFWRQTGHMQAVGESWNEVVMITVVDVTGAITTVG